MYAPFLFFWSHLPDKSAIFILATCIRTLVFFSVNTIVSLQNARKVFNIEIDQTKILATGFQVFPWVVSLTHWYMVLIYPKFECKDSSSNDCKQNWDK